MKYFVKGVVIIFIEFLSLLPGSALAERKVFGVLVDKAQQPVSGAIIKLWDSDPGRDHKMGETITQADGGYLLEYSKGSYDGPKTRFHTNWRPDIYVTAEIKDDSDSPWYKAARSKTHKNHKLRDDLRVDLETYKMNLPVDCQASYEMEVWQGDALFQGNTMDHTATRTRIYQTCNGSRSLLTTVDKCNTNYAIGIRAGRCPGADGMRIRWRYESQPRKNDVIFPVACHVFGYQTYGLIADSHLCNNDAFMEMGIVVSGEMPHNKIIERICANKNYTDSTGRDPKYTPTFENVDDFIKEYGWGRLVGGGGGGTPQPHKPRHQN